MKSILSKIFPAHSTGTVITIIFFFLITLLVAGFTLNEIQNGGTYTANYVLISVFGAVAVLLYLFDRNK